MAAIEVGEIPEQLFSEVIYQLFWDYNIGIVMYWLKQEHDQEKIDIVAQTLHEIFIHGFYEMNCIHADPNPGNFIIDHDLHIGLLDFGCVIRLFEQMKARVRMQNPYEWEGK